MDWWSKHRLYMSKQGDAIEEGSSSNSVANEDDGEGSSSAEASWTSDSEEDIDNTVQRKYVDLVGIKELPFDVPNDVWYVLIKVSVRHRLIYVKV